MINPLQKILPVLSVLLTLVTSMLSTSVTTAQPPTEQLIYSMHTSLGMNGPIKTVTTYKYTRLKYSPGKEEEAKGTLYSVIKNRYDSTGLIVADSTATYLNPKVAEGYCKTYEYSFIDSTPVILITSRFGCVPPYDHPRTQLSIVELTSPNDSTVLAREYPGTELPRNRSKVLTSYRFTLRDSLIQRTVFEAWENRKHHYGTTTYLYDSYNNFTQTTLTVNESPKETISHKIFKIDRHENALLMFNYINENPEPEFMTVYEYEYYE